MRAAELRADRGCSRGLRQKVTGVVNHYRAQLGAFDLAVLRRAAASGLLAGVVRLGLWRGDLDGCDETQPTGPTTAAVRRRLRGPGRRMNQDFRAHAGLSIPATSSAPAAGGSQRPRNHLGVRMDIGRRKCDVDSSRPALAPNHAAGMTLATRHTTGGDMPLATATPTTLSWPPPHLQLVRRPAVSVRCAIVRSAGKIRRNPATKPIARWL
jgi:hypothetical protein